MSEIRRGHRRFALILAAFALLCAAFLGGCLGTSLWSPDVSLILAGERPFELDTAHLSRLAEHVVIGEVVALSTSLETTPHGETIITSAEILVLERLKGAAPERLTVRARGGQVGDLVMWVSHEPRFRHGETTLLFLGPSPDGRGHAVCGALRGKLTLLGDRVAEMPLSKAALLDRIARALSGQDIGPDPEFIPLGDNGASYPPSAFQPLAYSYDETRWPQASPTVTYRVNAASSWIAPIQAAAAAWNDAGSRLTFSYGGTTGLPAGFRDGQNVIDATRSYGNTGWPAQATVWYRNMGSYGNIIECDIQINLYYRWANGANPTALDIQSVVTHELGHWLMLGDLYRPQEAEMTMYGWVTNGETKKRTLEEPDRRGILDIYGAR